MRSRGSQSPCVAAGVIAKNSISTDIGEMQPEIAHLAKPALLPTRRHATAAASGLNVAVSPHTLLPTLYPPPEQLCRLRWQGRDGPPRRTHSPAAFCGTGLATRCRTRCHRKPGGRAEHTCKSVQRPKQDDLETLWRRRQSRYGHVCLARRTSTS